MGIFSRIKSLFAGPSSPDGFVPFYDVPSRRVIHIPPTELRPGCVQARVEGVEGIVWILPDQLQESPIRHPPFDEEMRSHIRDIQAAFAEHRELSVEQWEEGFRRDGNPAREIAGFSYAADVYRLFTKEEQDATRRADVYRLLIACMTTSPESVWHVVKLNALTRPEAERIVRRFYGGEKAGDPATV
jgi:hypothetical protein